MTEITETDIEVVVGGETVTGVEWTVDVTMPNAADVTPDADTYRLRNDGKTRTSYFWGGIPYARQPVGLYRFRASKKQDPTGPIDARTYGSVSTQEYVNEPTDTGAGRSDLGIERGLSAWGALGTRKSESCLNLNIWSPDPTASLPIIVQFHGGGGKYLSGNDDRMAGHRLGIKGAVVIRVNVRLGTLGNYYLPFAENDADYAGVNYNVTDAASALEWVREHGGSFGGDVTKITIMGGSFGGNLCWCLNAHPTFRDLFDRMWPDGASAGTDIRWDKDGTQGPQRGYGRWGDYRHDTFVQNADRFTSKSDPTKTMTHAIKYNGYKKAMRENLYVSDFLSSDGGGYGVHLSTATEDTYAPVRSLTIMKDDVTCFRFNNRSAAISGDLSNKNVVITVAQNESSTVGNGSNAARAPQDAQSLSYSTTNAFARGAAYDTEWNGAAATPTWGTLDFTEPQVPWGTATEPNAMLFNFTYQHTAYHQAKAVHSTGATAYLLFNNWKANGSSATRTGHTAAEPWLFNNPLWGVDQNGGDELIEERDLKMADTMAQMVVNFAATGNPNTLTTYAGDFDLFATPLVQPLTAFDPVDKNWNVWGNNNRNSVGAPATITNTPDFWAHAWDWIDGKIGV